MERWKLSLTIIVGIVVSATIIAMTMVSLLGGRSPEERHKMGFLMPDHTYGNGVANSRLLSHGPPITKDGVAATILGENSGSSGGDESLGRCVYSSAYRVVHLVHLASSDDDKESHDWGRQFEWIRTEMFRGLRDSRLEEEGGVGEGKEDEEGSGYRVVAIDTTSFCNNTIIVYPGGDPAIVTQYLEAAQSLGINILGGIHLNDDKPDCTHKDAEEQESYEWYRQVPFVYRTYYSAKLRARFGDIVEWLPLGWQTGFGPVPASTVLPAFFRPSYCGYLDISSDEAKRAPVIKDLFKKEGRCENLKALGAKKGANLNVRDYNHLLLGSAIVLCPGARNRDSNRIYEALEAGAIPILDRSPSSSGDDESKCIYGDSSAFDPFASVPGWEGECPLPYVTNWKEDLTNVLDSLADPLTAESVQQRVMSWWALVKRRWQEGVAMRIAEGYRGSLRQHHHLS